MEVEEEELEEEEEELEEVLEDEDEEDEEDGDEGVSVTTVVTRGALASFSVNNGSSKDTRRGRLEDFLAPRLIKRANWP